MKLLALIFLSFLFREGSAIRLGSSLTIPSCEGSTAAIISAACFTNRYLSLQQYDNYPLLMKLSQELSSANSAQAKGQQMLSVIRIPELQESLSSALPRALSDLTANTSNAQSQLTQGVTSMRTQGVQAVTAMSDEFKRVYNLFEAEVKADLKAAGAMDTANLNGMIQLANTRNLNASAKVYTASLANVTASVPNILTTHETNLTTLVAGISDALLSAPSSITLSQTNMSTMVQNLLKALGTSQATKNGNVQNQSITDITTRMNTVMTAVNGSNVSIANALNASELDLNTTMSDKRRNVWNQLLTLNSAINTTSLAWRTAFNSTRDSIAATMNRTTANQTLNYSISQYSSGNLTALLRASSIPNITNWGVNANVTLSRMTGLLSDAKTNLTRQLSGNSSSGVISSVDSTLAKVGAQQQAIDDQLAAGAKTQLEGLQNITDRLGANKVMFQNAMAQVMQFQNSFGSDGGDNITASAQAGMNAAIALLDSLQTALTWAANNVTTTTQDAQKNLSLAAANVKERIGNYSVYLKEMNSNVSFGISNFSSETDSAFKNATAVWNAFVRDAAANRTMFQRAMNTALTQSRTTNKSMDSSTVKTNSIISSTLTSVSRQIEAFMEAFGPVMPKVDGAQPPPADATDYAATAAGLVNNFKSGADRTNRKNQADLEKFSSSQRDQLSQLRDLNSALYKQAAFLWSKSDMASGEFSSAVSNAVKMLNNSINAFNLTILDSGELREAVNKEMKIESILEEVSGLSNRVSQSNGTVFSVSNQLKQLNKTMTEQMGKFSSNSNNSVNSINNILQGSTSVNKILADEILTLLTAVGSANSSFVSAIGAVNGITFGNASSLTNQTMSDRNTTLQRWNQNLDWLIGNLSSAGSIVSNLTGINSTMRAVIQNFDSNLTSLVNAFNVSATSASSLTTQMMTGLLATSKTLQAQMNGTEKDNTIESLRGVLQTVAGAVSGSAANTSQLLLNMTGLVAGGILGQSGSSQSSLDQTGAVALQALNAAAGSVEQGVGAVDLLDAIMAASAKERKNSAASVANSITANQAAMSAMMTKAMKAAAGSAGISSANASAVDMPSFLAIMGNHLDMMIKHISSITEGLAMFAVESQQGIQGEQVALGEGLRTAGNFVADGVSESRSIMQEEQSNQYDLDDALLQLTDNQERVDRLLTYLSQNISDIGNENLGKLAVSDADVSKTVALENKAFTDLESTVGDLISRASAAGFVSI
jgi:hypothetical protein